MFITLGGALTIKELLINEQIRSEKVRLIGNDGEQIGIVSGKEANEMALEKRLDLVMISPKAKPPVCKIMDYGKYRYEKIKKEKEAKKNQSKVVIKEIRFSPRTQQHDLDIKARQAIDFLKDDKKVKIRVRFRGREVAYKDSAMEKVNNFIDTLTEEYGKLDKRPKFANRNITAIVVPKK